MLSADVLQQPHADAPTSGSDLHTARYDAENCEGFDLPTVFRLGTQRSLPGSAG